MHCLPTNFPEEPSFLTVHAAVYNLFNLGRYLISAAQYRLFRMRALACWKSAVA